MNALHIVTNRLCIRSLRPEDLQGFHAYRSNPEVTRYQGFDVMSLEQARQFITDNANVSGKPGQWVQYAIEAFSSAQLVGDCALLIREHEPDTAEIGMTLAPGEQGKGYAREALEGLMDLLFRAKGIRRIVETVDAENTACVRLLERAGFRREGYFIENIFFKGKWGSEFQYAMLRREWEVLQLTR